MTGIATAVVGSAIIGGIASSRSAGRQADAATESARIQAESGEAARIAAEEAAQRAQGFLDPFAAVGQRGIDESGFLANPQAQFDFLQNNPLFQSSLNLRDRDTAAAAASTGRLGAGDTFLDFQQNALLAAQPLIERQRQDIGNLLNLGSGIAGSQANIETGLGATTSGLLTDIGNVQGAGIVGAANARSAGNAGIANALQSALLSGATLANRPQTGGA